MWLATHSTGGKPADIDFMTSDLIEEHIGHYTIEDLFVIFEILRDEIFAFSVFGCSSFKEHVLSVKITVSNYDNPYRIF